MTDNQVLRRWRLLLGRYADQQIAAQSSLTPGEQQLEDSLEYLYGREYQRRGLAARAGSLDPSQIRAIDWLGRTRKLFPKPVFERLQQQALERYGMSELLNDPAVIANLEPNQAIVKTLLSLRGRLSTTTRDAVKMVIAKTVEDITRKLKPQITNSITGQRFRFRSSPLASAQNFDWRKTIAANLKHFNRERNQLVIARPCFNARVKPQLPWDLVLCIDQSGSMTDSIIYAAVLAGILAGLPNVRVRLLIFDTQVVDLSYLAHDPVEVLLTVQLGGGTDIGKAVSYGETLIQNPRRTIFTLISDFCEGAPPTPLINSVRRMAEARVTLIGLAALDDEATPIYDKNMGQRLATAGMHIAALTPEHFAQWLGEIIHG
ncbi:MAG: VWA containing CoxE family protein [Cellvibrio sp. 79]|nr:MAG: VWA containing CoxE family protein [Cellvibrio sp. 79]